MNHGADFLALYEALGVGPECDPDAFKRAYRRRVSGLHPDRAGGDPRDEDTLKTLNYAYSAALEFHRAHGRFPGTTVRASHAGPATRTEIAHGGEVVDTEARGPSRWRMAVWLGLAVALIALLLAANDDDRAADQAMPYGAERPATHVASPRTATEPVLKLGMSPDEVIAVIGPPFSSDDTGQQWLYGASWVRVACGQLVDWYSSPLQPLKVAHDRPGPSDTVDDFRPRRHCPTTS
ncbi:DnaJ domain-containing protein [Pseudoxanthomonas sp.]|uniref:DnaJ domain-containing protein n=1 Tax=Pseudoxanthomonas sp. TaxID=1871049 RepID=UPI002FE1599E